MKKLRELVSVSAGKDFVKTKSLVAAGAFHVGAGLAGFLCARATVAGSLVPFGLSLLAGCPQSLVPAVAIGVFGGYFLPAVSTGAFRLLAAMLAVLAVRLLLSGIPKISNHPLFISSICFLAVFFTSVVSIHNIRHGLLGILAESLLAAAGAVVFRESLRQLSQPALSAPVESSVSLFFFLAVLTMGLDSFPIGGIFAGSAAGFFLVLVAAKYGGTVSGAICGTTFAFSSFLAGASGEVACLYALTGLFAGAVCGFGKTVQSLVPSVFCILLMIIGGHSFLSIKLAGEIGCATIAFLLLPRQADTTVGRLFSVRPRLLASAHLQRAVTLRLQTASDALSDVSETVDQVANELSKINSPDFSEVISAIEQEACAGCKLRLHCWEKRREETMNALLCMINAVKNGSKQPEESAPESFQGRCVRTSGMANTVYRRMSDYAARLAAENRIEEIRSVVSDQFDGLSSMLSEMAADLEDDLKYDAALAEKAAAALHALNIQSEECSCRLDRYGRAHLEMKIRKTKDLVLNKYQIMKLISVACERDFDVPAVHTISENILICLSEHAALRIDIGVEQKSACASSVCGDAYRYFSDGKGHFIMILSDGMGTGGRAAVDGAMASGLMSRLLKAGFGYDSALKILNSSMLFKSTDESLATLDIASIDLFTGRIELYKAGAAPTLIRRSGRCGKAESTSLPAGILRDIGFDKAVLKCKVGDIVVLLSDGAVCDGTDWIRTELEAWNGGTAQELSERLCEGARRRRSDRHEDDITVMTAILKKSV
ncbi:MAG: SpoIIE family protein phosphatase [Clostridia bacterium]|nr:SpoIIE family protein phosphatase [Clostridia bacterium]